MSAHITFKSKVFMAPITWEFCTGAAAQLLQQSQTQGSEEAQALAHQAALKTMKTEPSLDSDQPPVLMHQQSSSVASSSRTPWGSDLPCWSTWGGGKGDQREGGGSLGLLSGLFKKATSFAECKSTTTTKQSEEFQLAL